MKKLLVVVMVLFVAISLAGCDAVQRKFTRKKKNVKPVPKLYQLKKYDVKPSAALYSKHYAYWQSWMSELLQDLGDNRKRDTRSVEEAINQAHDMQNILVKEKADELEKQIKHLEDARDIIVREELSQFNRTQVMGDLERADRNIKRDFSVKRIKKYIKESFDEPAPRKSSGASFSASMPSENAMDDIK